MTLRGLSRDVHCALDSMRPGLPVAGYGATMESNHPAVGLPRPAGFEEEGADTPSRLNKPELRRSRRRGNTFGSTCATDARRSLIAAR